MAKTKVLVVDDSETMRTMVKMTLSFDYDPILCSDGEEGLCTFLKNQNDISLIVTDVNMPKLDGISMTAEIRKTNSIIPILILTTETEERLRKKGADAGANGWMTKPFKPKVFIDVIKQLLS
jgi:two-component system chemotaxis response regulator CheY